MTTPILLNKDWVDNPGPASARITPIHALPGLFISGRRFAFSASATTDSIQSHAITHILAILEKHELPPYSPDIRKACTIYHVDVADDPFVDIAVHLKEACDFLDHALAQSDCGAEAARDDGERDDRGEGKGVLVHCRQGISRSGAVVVAYLMRTLGLRYQAALELARESRDVITPNEGFGRQLEVWRECGYDVFEERDGERVEKDQYRRWKTERDEMVGRGEDAMNRERARAMAGVAAGLMKRHMKMLEGVQREREREGG